MHCTGMFSIYKGYLDKFNINPIHMSFVVSLYDHMIDNYFILMSSSYRLILFTKIKIEQIHLIIINN